MHGSRSKIPSKNISSGSVARRDLIPALNGQIVGVISIIKTGVFYKCFNRYIIFYFILGVKIYTPDREDRVS
jgi:hypothetical protein